MVNLLSRFGVINVSTVISMGGYSCGGLALYWRSEEMLEIKKNIPNPILML